MQSSSIALTRDLVLVGGGHTHALVLRKWAMKPLPGVRVTLVNPGPTTAYSGMLPGHVAGHYSRDALDIDLVRLSQFAGARLVMAAASGINRETRVLHIDGAPDIGFDVLSLDIGVTSIMRDLPGFAEFAAPAKPLGPFAHRWQSYLEATPKLGVAVLGGGIAGVELALAMRHRLQTMGHDIPVTIIEKDRALSALVPTTRQTLLARIAAVGVTLRENCTVTSVATDHVALASGAPVAADFVVGTTGAAPYPWLAATGLTDAAGFMPVNPNLQSADPKVFAVGDCAHLTETPRPKAGVYAVRQAPVLLGNLKAALSESGGMKPYRAQKDYLKLVSLGEKSAQAERFGMSLSGPALWRWKDRIDRAFMDKLNELPAPDRPVPPYPRAAGAATAHGADRCGGCGSKLGPAALATGLSQQMLGDDAAMIQTGRQQQVISTDHLRGFVADHASMTEIAAIHALGDIWAMGATPQAATASITLPHQSSPLAARALHEIMETARRVMADAGAEIVGGHSTLGAELTIGFTVTGICDRAPITLAGAQPGDQLILTKPIGTGVIMAAHMRHRARGADVADALTSMKQPQSVAAAILQDARAMTDVTGFGLAGHLSNICTASGVGAQIHVDRVPVLPGAEDLSAQGIQSTLYPENAAGFAGPATPRAALVFDPQTSGGLLAAVARDADVLCDKLNGAGYTAAVIGQVTDQVGQVEIV
ncbi:MAG: selenide, water dikinase SelD [Pseudomonadota bacterium]